MAKSKSIINKTSATRADNIACRLQDLGRRLHQAYCWAATVEAALVGADADMTPEFAVSVRQGLVMTLDPMSFEVKAICAAFNILTKTSSAKKSGTVRRTGKNTRRRA